MFRQQERIDKYIPAVLLFFNSRTLFDRMGRNAYNSSSYAVL